MQNDKIVFDRYRVLKRIGRGSFGQIYAAEDILTNEAFAVKLESDKAKLPQLPLESKLYEALSSCINVPKMHHYGNDSGDNIIVLDLLGKSLENYVQLRKKPFSTKTILMLAVQMLSAIQFMHEKDFIHRDVKPENFVMGKGEDSGKLFMIDFGLCKRYRDADTLEHIPYCENKALTGTARFASVNTLKGCESSRRDDLESLGYVLAYLHRGTLPWITTSAENDPSYKMILDIKSKTSIESLFDGLPIEFIEYFETVRAMGFEEKPKYSALREMFIRAFLRHGYVWDNKYDWCDGESKSVDRDQMALEIDKAKIDSKILLGCDVSGFFTTGRAINLGKNNRQKDELNNLENMKKNSEWTAKLKKASRNR